MLSIIAKPTVREPKRQRKAAGNGAAAPLADGATGGLPLPSNLHEPCDPPMPVGGAAEPPLRPISRLAALCRRPNGVTAVTTVGALLANLPGTATADIGDCLHDLCRDLVVSFDRPGAPRLSCRAAAHQLPTGTVITLDLIADLLVSNAYLFGFVPPAGGRIAVAFSALEATFELTIDDSGLVDDGTGHRRADAVTMARLLVGELGGWLETPPVVGGSRCIVSVPRLSNAGSG